MKISVVHVHQKFYPYEGGSTQRLLNQLSFIDKEKFDIHVISEKIGDEPSEEVYKNIKIYRYRNFREIPFLLRKISSENDLKILHAHNFRPSFYASIFNFFAKKKLIVEMHSMYKVQNKYSEYLGKKILSIADSIIVLSKRSQDIIREELKITKNINVIYNGIDLEEFRGANKELLNVDEKLESYLSSADEKKDVIVGYIGSIRSFQGIDNIIKIVNSVTSKNVKFLIVGGSEEEVRNLKSKIINSNVFVRSFVKKEYAKNIYKNMDVLLMPRPKVASTDSALPLKPIEAIAAGNKIFSTDVGGMLELKKITNTNKILFMTVTQMIEKLNNINLNELNEEYKLEGNLDLFDISEQVKKIEKIYLDILSTEG